MRQRILPVLVFLLAALLLPPLALGKLKVPLILVSPLEY